MRSFFIILFSFYISSLAIPKGWQRVSVGKVLNSKPGARTKPVLQQEKEYTRVVEGMTDKEKQQWLDSGPFCLESKEQRRKLLREGYRYKHVIFTICEINLAQRDGETDLVQMLLAGDRNDIPLCQAVRKKDPFLIETLLGLGANPFGNYHTAIKTAIDEGLSEIVGILLKCYDPTAWDILHQIEREYTAIIVEETDEYGAPMESALEVIREWLENNRPD